MRIRRGFVSNSSTSSFVCLVSGHVEAERDASASDVGMCECENDHVFCNHYLLPTPPGISPKDVIESYVEFANRYRECTTVEETTKQITEALNTDDVEKLTGEVVEEHIREEIDEEFPGFGDASALRCPICTMTHIPDEAMLKHVLRLLHKTREDLTAELREKFDGDFKAFEEAEKAAAYEK